MSDRQFFSDSIQGNLDVLAELLPSLPHAQRETAKAVALEIEGVVEKIQRKYGRNGAAALGVAFAVNQMSKILAERSQSGDRPLIQLLS